MNTTIIIYVISWLVPIVAAVLYFAGFISGQGALAQNATLNYMLSIVSVALSMLTVYMALKLFALPLVKSRLSILKEPARSSFYYTLCRVRIIAILMVLIINGAIWYLLDSSTPLYLSAIMLVALLFCIPRKLED